MQGWEGGLTPPLRRPGGGSIGLHYILYGPINGIRGYVKMGGVPHAHSIPHQNRLRALVGHAKPVCCGSGHLPSRLNSDQPVRHASIRGFEIGLKFLESPRAYWTRETVLE